MKPVLICLTLTTLTLSGLALYSHCANSATADRLGAEAYNQLKTATTQRDYLCSLPEVQAVAGEHCQAFATPNYDPLPENLTWQELKGAAP